MTNTLNTKSNTSNQVTDIAARMQAIANRMTQAQKTIIAGQYEREVIITGLSNEVSKLEQNLKGLQTELKLMDSGFEKAKGHYRKLADTMDEYLVKSA